MKGYFDIVIFDECHVCKDGDSAQGNAMHCLIKATKKQLALTGTIAGGKAEDLYYLIYRLAPWKMTSKGTAGQMLQIFPSNTEKWSSAMNMRDHLRRRILRRQYLPAAGVYRHQRQSRESALRSLQTFCWIVLYFLIFRTCHPIYRI